MDTKTISLLREWAKTYNTESFIKDDPVRFPHRFTEKRDIEISAFLTAWISYGRRAHILQKAEELHRLMGESPYEFIRTGETSFAPLRNRPVRRRDTFYRFYTYHDLHLLCCRLKDIYDTYDCMEDAMAAAGPCEDPILRLQQLFADLNGIPVLHGTSACKRLAMFLRWMVRTDGAYGWYRRSRYLENSRASPPINHPVGYACAPDLLALGLDRPKNRYPSYGP